MSISDRGKLVYLTVRQGNVLSSLKKYRLTNEVPQGGSSAIKNDFFYKTGLENGGFR